MAQSIPPPATPGMPPRPAEMSEEQLLLRLALLQPLAAGNRGPVALDDPRRIAAAEFSWLINTARERGVAISVIVEHTGTAWRTLRSRLARHGYVNTPPSVAAYQGTQSTRPAAEECKNGHLFTEENTYRYADAKGLPHRMCRRCRAERMAHSRAARPAADSTKAAPQMRNRLRHDQQTLSAATVPDDGEVRGLSVADVVALHEQVTGRTVAPATIRAYRSRGLMPASGEDGRWSEEDIRDWLARRPSRADEATVTKTQRRLSTLKAPGAIERAVGKARADGVSWAAIGSALGLTPQQAWSRYAAAEKAQH